MHNIKRKLILEPTFLADKKSKLCHFYRNDKCWKNSHTAVSTVNNVDNLDMSNTGFHRMVLKALQSNRSRFTLYKLTSCLFSSVSFPTSQITGAAVDRVQMHYTPINTMIHTLNHMVRVIDGINVPLCVPRSMIYSDKPPLPPLSNVPRTTSLPADFYFWVMFRMTR